MGITVSSASGIAIDNSISDYSYSEEANSIEPSSLTGGSGAATVTLDAEDFSISTGSTYIGSNMTLTDGPGNSVQFKTTSINKNTSGMVTITGDTLTAKMNVEVTANPQPNTSLKTAINYYCGLAGITPQYDSSITSDLGRTINFIGWKGNLWEHLKMLCAGVMSTSGANIEMYVLNGVLRFRKALDTANLIDLTNEIASQDISFDSTNLAQSIQINNYTTSYGSNKIMYELNQSSSKPNTGPFATQPATTSVISVNAGETVVKRIKVNASLTGIDQPGAVASMSHPYTGSQSVYTVVGTDNLVIDPAQWNAGYTGDRVTVAIVGDAKDEVEITVVAPPAPTGTGEGADGGQGGTGNTGIVQLAKPVLSFSGTGPTNYRISWTSITGAENYILTVVPSTGVTRTYTLTETFKDFAFPTTIAYTISVKAVTNSAIVGGVPNSYNDASSPIDITLSAISDPDRISGGGGTGGGGITVAGTGPDNTVAQPTLPSVPRTGSTDPNNAPSTLTFASYKIGIDIGVDDTEYPAFYLVGTGVFYDKVQSTLSTGLSSSVTTNVVGATIDNPFITTSSDQTAKGALAVDRFKYPRVTMAQAVDSPRTFGTLPGSTQEIDGETFRIESVSYSPSSVSINSVKV